MLNRHAFTLFAVTALAAAPFVSQGEDTPTSLRVPAFTAYSEPDVEDVDVSPEQGLTGWTNAKDRIVWYGNIETTGTLNVTVSLRMPAKAVSRLRLTMTAQSSGKRIIVGGIRAVEGGTNGRLITVDFGQVNISSSGYYRFTLEGVSKNQASFGDVDALLLSGQATQNAHFNLRLEQRGAPSVHLSYPIPKDAQVQWFYNEVTAKTDPLWTYYMACGWHRGYFGMQVNSPTERRIIFSVWDSGKEAADRSKVADDNRVKLLAKGAGVVAESFGNEGTGGHSHLVYNWKTGGTYRFLVAAQPDGTATIYTGWFFFPGNAKVGDNRPVPRSQRRQLPARPLLLRRGLQQCERAAETSGRVRAAMDQNRRWNLDGANTATFTHTGKDSRTDYDAGAYGDRFYLTGGGFTDGKVKYRDSVQRPLSGKPPLEITLPDNRYYLLRRH